MPDFGIGDERVRFVRDEAKKIDGRKRWWQGLRLRAYVMIQSSPINAMRPSATLVTPTTT